MIKDNNEIFFNDIAKDWNKDIPIINYKIARAIIENLHIGPGCSVLDAACGTGILYSILENKSLFQYVGIDISGKMIEEFRNNYPLADLRKADFESKVLLEIPFDYIIIFNSIPHFNNLDAIFENAYNNLNSEGKFIIAHSKTRQGLKEHHSRIGFVSDKKNPIPTDEQLLECCKIHGFSDLTIVDIDYFCFSARRK
ncbi:class I SAM-dependent DNA methyltransferase [Clostridium lacusfryxellense]|uniref:class I SAM-dependent DNA methyltransferase n=1 Tax=Clostridium lacusfryxellense TaxID=205328 RepID=UPI001C0C529A|nr:class I SAM-dependent methyltransferase [Clostridium lacusfryxellense]MBU3114467.1 class I SAM-dependent methyltransferase [Clostridium lacusfryxellense]